MLSGDYRRVFEENLVKLLDTAESEGFKTVVLAHPSNITYATGIRSPSGAIVLSRECGHSLIVPLLDYYRALEQAPRGFEVLIAYRGGEERISADVPQSKVVRGGVVDAVKTVISRCGSTRAGGDLDLLSKQMAEQLSKAGVENLTKPILRARAVKSQGEIELIEHAVRIAEEAFTSLVYKLEEGVTEAWATGMLFWEMMRRGAWYEAFPSIVAFYSNTAHPHHTPTSLRLGRPGPVLVDWGAIYAGYRSDMTRSFWHGGNMPERFRRVVESVLQAVEEATDIIAAGVEAWEPDNRAREVLRRDGLDRYFIHGLGHGVGVDIHEEPYLRPGSKTVLEKGMVVTVEPGVYLQGMFGVRIEDLVVVTSRGARRLTRLPRLEVP